MRWELGHLWRGPRAALPLPIECHNVESLAFSAMVLLTPGEFLIELDKLFSSTKDKGSVYVVMKRSACPISCFESP